MSNQKFASVEEASKRWIKEGKTYKDALNDWLDVIYIDEGDPTEECPEETRQDMAPYVLEKIKEFNEKGHYQELRELFPPDNDPMNWKGVTHCVSQVALLPDNEILVTVGEWYQNRRMYIINGNSWSRVEDGAFMFGMSHNKKYFAKVCADRIDVCNGWNGGVISSFNPPTSYGKEFEDQFPSINFALNTLNFEDMKINNVVVFPEGNKIGIASETGIFVIDQKGSQFINTENFEDLEEYVDEEEEFIFEFVYPHIDVSPDAKYIAVGSQDSSHLVFENTGGKWEVVATVKPRSSYPNLTKFNYLIEEDKNYENSGPQLLLAACHFNRSSSISLPINNITPNFTVSAIDADDTLNYVDDKKWIFAAGNYSWGWALGSNDGYIWFKHYNGGLMGYLHVGGTVLDMDLSEDGKTMAVASSSGQVILYKIDDLFYDTMFREKENRNERRKDDFAITNSAFKDSKRYLFWQGHEPMIW